MKTLPVIVRPSDCVTDGWAALSRVVRDTGPVITEVRFPFCSSDWYVFENPAAIEAVQARVRGGLNIPVVAWSLSRVAGAPPVVEGSVSAIRGRLAELNNQAWVLLRSARGGAVSWHSMDDDDAFDAALAAAGHDGLVAAWDAKALWRLEAALRFKV